MRSIKMMILFLLMMLMGEVYSNDEDGVWSISVANNDFGCRLYNALGINNKENFFFSPLSVSITLGMLLFGARGRTAKELSEVMGFKKMGPQDRRNVSLALGRYVSSTRSEEYELKVANLIMVENSMQMNKAYRSAMRRIFNSKVEKADFHRDAAKIIRRVNAWVKKSTKGMVPSLLDSLDPNEVMVVLNAMYFRGFWAQQFDPTRTSHRTFFNYGTTAKKVPMMRMEDMYFGYLSERGFSALELPYKGKMSMLILLPKTKTGLPALEKSLSETFISTTLSRLKLTSVNVYLPKFKVEHSSRLEAPLRRLGMRNVFGSGANFTGISRSMGLRVSEVIHKASLSVDEQGTVAAAATAVHVVLLSASDDPVEFVVDRPFIYAIIDRKRGFILFMGRACQL